MLRCHAAGLLRQKRPTNPKFPQTFLSLSADVKERDGGYAESMRIYNLPAAIHPTYGTQEAHRDDDSFGSGGNAVEAPDEESYLNRAEPASDEGPVEKATPWLGEGANKE